MPILRWFPLKRRGWLLPPAFVLPVFLLHTLLQPANLHAGVLQGRVKLGGKVREVRVIHHPGREEWAKAILAHTLAYLPALETYLGAPRWT